MATATFVHDGNSVDYTPSSAVAAGDVVVQENLIGIARTPIAANALGSLAVAGIFDIAKAQEAIASGIAVYWDADGDPYGGTAGSGCLTATATGNTLAGWTIAAAAETDSTARVRLIQVPSVSIYGGVSVPIADPGDAGAIPVAASGHCLLTTADAETRTLADPTSDGQELLIALDTDGGDCVITAASAINQTGNNTITLDDAGDVIRLVAIEVGANKRWRVVVNDGCTLATV